MGVWKLDQRIFAVSSACMDWQGRFCKVKVSEYLHTGLDGMGRIRNKMSSLIY